MRVPVGPTEAELARLDAAVAAVNTTRAAVLAAPDAVTSAATALDAADEAGATGRRALAAPARRDARMAAAGVDAALAGLPAQVSAYEQALQRLESAASPLEPAQRAAVTAVTEAGSDEAEAVAGFGQSATSIWPAYAALDSVQSTWLDRASAGWFRTEREAADAYVLLRRPVLAPLQQARSTLQEADATRRPATEAVRAALARADRALGALRAPAG